MSATCGNSDVRGPRPRAGGALDAPGGDATLASVSSTVIIAVIIAGCFVILRDFIGHIFTSDP